MYLDDDEARGMALQVQAAEDLRLETLDVEREEVDLRGVDLVE